MDIHYIWVGNFDPNRSGAYDNPNKLAHNLFKYGQQTRYRMHFWCRNQFVEEFRSKLEPFISIESIESFLNTLPLHLQTDAFITWSAVRLRFMLQHGIGTIREIVTVKECFSLFLCYALGGLVLDAGCSIIDDNKPFIYPTFPFLRTYTNLIITRFCNHVTSKFIV